MKRIILCSNSPRRQELLAGLDLPFTVDTGNTFEEHLEGEVEAHEVPLLLSAGKSQGFHRPLEPDEVLITSDTVVIVDREVLGKPHSREDAVRMLQLLSGRAHEVVTAVTIRDCSRQESFSVSTQVHFEPLSQEQIDYYIDHYQPFDKAGAYGAQGKGAVFIEGIRGDFFNVMGLPLCRLAKDLERLGIPLVSLVSEG